MKIMTVCLGNICRSPAAEAVLVRRLEAAGIDDVTVTSAGTADYHIGNRPHAESIREGEARGYAFTSVAQQFAAHHFAEADVILAMDRANEADILALARSPEDKAKVVRLGAFASDPTRGVLDVPDPWGLPRQAYVAMYDQIEDAVDGLVRAIQDGTLANSSRTEPSGADAHPETVNLRESTSSGPPSPPEGSSSVTSTTYSPGWRLTSKR